MKVKVTLLDKEPFEAEVIGGPFHHPSQGTSLVVARDTGELKRVAIDQCRVIEPPASAGEDPRSRSPDASPLSSLQILRLSGKVDPEYEALLLRDLELRANNAARAAGRG